MHHSSELIAAVKAVDSGHTPYNPECPDQRALINAKLVKIVYDQRTDMSAGERIKPTIRKIILTEAGYHATLPAA